MSASLRRWLLFALGPLIAAMLFAAPAAPANAEPGSGSPATAGGEDKADPLLSDVMEATNRRFISARAAVAKSTKIQATLTRELKAATARRDALIPEVRAIAAQQYRLGEVSAASFLLSSHDSTDFLAKAVSLDEINTLHDRKLRELNKAVDEVSQKSDRLAAEIAAQKQQQAVAKRQESEAKKALALVGGNSLTSGFVDATSKVAAPAPRNSGGGFSPEGCNQQDPTTGSCVTARTLHMYKEVRKAGFNRFVGCYRSGGPFEHPKGRACDWSLQKKGFATANNTDMRRYGNDLMAFLVRNADRLGVYYVIWYEQIWLPATGWNSYSGPSAHTDHVHVSML